MIYIFVSGKQLSTHATQIKAKWKLFFCNVGVFCMQTRGQKREQEDIEWENSLRWNAQWRLKDKYVRCGACWSGDSPQGSFSETLTCTCKTWERPNYPDMKREDLMLLSARNTHRICLLSEMRKRLLQAPPANQKTTLQVQFAFFFGALWKQMDFRNWRVTNTMQRRY